MRFPYNETEKSEKSENRKPKCRVTNIYASLTTTHTKHCLFILFIRLPDTAIIKQNLN